MAQTIGRGPDAASDGGSNTRPPAPTAAANTVVSAATRAASRAAPEVPSGPATTNVARPLARAREIVGQLAGLPRLAGAAGTRTESAAERIARRRRIAQATLDQEASSGETDWARVGVFGAGVAIGALIGAGAALLLAPATGYETRRRLAHRARDAGGRAADQWDDIHDDVRDRTRHGATRVKRAAASSRWAAEDAWARRRRD